MLKIVIIGSGNVACHLVKAFAKSTKTEVIQLYSRSKKDLNFIIQQDKITNDLAKLLEADLYIISISDNAIQEIANQLPFNDKFVVHTSGSVSLDVLSKHTKRGVFYPLQTFSVEKEVNYKEVPICLEAKEVTDYLILEKIAKELSDRIFQIDTNQRKAIHVAAVFVNNFVNHLYAIGKTICDQNKMPFEILKPLIAETANKINLLSPNEAQTGPAIRNDTNTINNHLAFLNNEQTKEIYTVLTKSILENGKEL